MGVWVVELPDGVGVGAVIVAYDLQIRADDARLVVVLPRAVALAAAMKMRAMEGRARRGRAD